MTWIVGASSLFGYGVMISDVRVTFSDGSEADMLRKAYKVAPFILAGFAGSVRIGMQLVGNLQRCLDQPELEGAQMAWQPDVVLNDWHPYAAEIFKQASDDERACGSQLVVVGVSPTKNMGAAVFPKIYVAKLTYPDFTPQYADGGFKVVHIGSGSAEQHYTSALSEHFRLDASSLQAEMGGFTSWSQVLGHSVSLLVRERPTPGIGAHVNIDTVRLGAFFSGNSDERIHKRDGCIVEVKMPPIASTFDEFLSLCDAQGKAASASVA